VCPPQPWREIDAHGYLCYSFSLSSWCTCVGWSFRHWELYFGFFVLVWLILLLISVVQVIAICLEDRFRNNVSSGTLNLTYSLTYSFVVFSVTSYCVTRFRDVKTLTDNSSVLLAHAHMHVCYCDHFPGLTSPVQVEKYHQSIIITSQMLYVPLPSLYCQSIKAWVYFRLPSVSTWL